MTLKEIEARLRAACEAGEHIHAVTAIALCEALKAERERIEAGDHRCECGNPSGHEDTIHICCDCGGYRP